MGISIQCWRARIGLFNNCAVKIKCNSSEDCENSEETFSGCGFPCLLLITTLLFIGCIELNPGPLSTDQLAELMKEYKNETTDLIKSFKMDTETNFETLSKKIEMNQVELKAAREEIKNLKDSNEVLKKQVESMDKIIRERNLILHGIKYEKTMKTEEEVIKIINNVLEIELKSDDIENCFTLGKKEEHRPILIKFNSVKTRNIVMKNAYKLKNSTYFLSEDLSSERRETLRVLKKHVSDARNAGVVNIKVRGHGLLLNGKFYDADKIPEYINWSSHVKSTASANVKVNNTTTEEGARQQVKVAREEVGGKQAFNKLLTSNARPQSPLRVTRSASDREQNFSKN